jgi:hypothetical protein
MPSTATPGTMHGSNFKRIFAAGLMILRHISWQHEPRADWSCSTRQTST